MMPVAVAIALLSFHCPLPNSLFTGTSSKMGRVTIAVLILALVLVGVLVGAVVWARSYVSRKPLRGVVLMLAHTNDDGSSIDSLTRFHTCFLTRSLTRFLNKVTLVFSLVFILLFSLVQIAVGCSCMHKSCAF